MSSELLLFNPKSLVFCLLLCLISEKELLFPETFEILLLGTKENELFLVDSLFLLSGNMVVSKLFNPVLLCNFITFKLSYLEFSLPEPLKVIINVTRFISSISNEYLFLYSFFIDAVSLSLI